MEHDAMNGLGVIFDMDGVLVDSYRPHLLSWQQAARENGLELTEAQFAGVFGRTSRDIIARLWPGRFSNGQIAAFDGRKEQAYRDIISHDFPEMAGAGDLVAALHAAGFATAIGSSGPPENIEVVRGALPHGDTIGATVSGAEVEHGKPDPGVFLLAAKKLGLAPAKCAVVEDATVGIEAARRAGMTAIAITGTTTREALAVRAHVVVDSLRELVPEAIAALIRSNARSAAGAS
jgi:HAD superfamily hydrolase (TIGR01509 family)